MRSEDLEEHFGQGDASDGAQGGPTRTLGLAGRSTPELLRLYAAILDELRWRGVVRSTNNPVADYAESLTARALHLTLAGKSETGYDAVGRDGLRYQVKSRRLTGQNGSRQLGFIRGLEPGKGPFDVLVGILFDSNFGVVKAALIPVAVVRDRVQWAESVKAWRLMLGDKVWTLPGVRDITNEIRAAIDREPTAPTRAELDERGNQVTSVHPEAVIDDAALLIRIPQLHRPGMAGEELYDCTRGVWKVGVRREGAAYAMAIVAGLVLEVYAIERWLPAGTTRYLRRHDVHVADRWEFVGKVAPEAVRSRYVGRSVKSYFPLGFRSPTRYVNC